MKALILIAHGSKKSISNDEFRFLVQNVKEQNKNKYELIEASFLEFEHPSIHDSVKSCVKKGVNDITFYPFFLNSGKHVLFDIPNIVEDLENIYENIHFKLLPHFGKSKDITSIVSSNI